MNIPTVNTRKQHLVYAGLTFIAVLILMQYLAYKEYLIIKEKEKDILLNELSNLRDRFNNILDTDSNKSNTISILYEEIEDRQKFDNVAKRILATNKSIDIIQLVHDNHITQVYPLPGNEKLLGIDVAKMPIQREEFQKAINRKGIYFAGPRKLTQGGYAILAKTPIYKNNQLKAFCVLITNFSTLQKVLKANDVKNNIFCYFLAKKNPSNKYETIKLTPTSPSKNTSVESVEIPEGDWKLEIAFSQKYKHDNSHYLISGFGFLLALLSGFSVYHLHRVLQSKIIEQSEKQFRDAFEMAAIGMGIVALDGSWLRVNKALCKMLGYSEEELLTLNFQQITHTDDLANDLKFYKPLLNGDTDFYSMEKRYIHKNGTIVWVHLNVVPVKNSQNQVIYTVAQIENISQRVESETKFKDLVEKSHVGVFILKDNTFVYTNPMITQKFGYTEEELIGSPGTNFIYEEDLPQILQNLEARKQGKTDKLNYEVRLRKKDGTLVWAEVFSSTTIYKGELAIIGTIIDRTEEKVALIELQKSEANLKSIFNATEVSYLLTDKNFDVVSLNSHFATLIKERTEHELQVGVNLFDQLGRVPKATKIQLQKAFIQVLISKRSIEYEQKVIDFDNIGAFKYYQLMISPVINNGDAIGICMAIINTSKRKILELENQKIITDLSQRNRDLEQFSYILSHNIRIPISNLLGLLKMLDHELTDEDQTFIMDSFKQSVTALDEVVADVNQTLSLHKNISEAKTKVDLKKVLAEVRDELNESIYCTKSKISSDFNAVESLNSISPYIHSIFLNLISNSLRFSSPERIPEIKIWTEKKDEKIVIHFQDNGIGIDMNKYEKQIFVLYKKFDLQRAGKGMGLFLTKAQVNALHGDIKMESELNKGTHVTISLPV